MCCASLSPRRFWKCRSSEAKELQARKASRKISKSESRGTMSKTIWVGAVAYNPKVVTIWEGMGRYFHEEAHLPFEVVLFQSYEPQVIALLAQPGDSLPRIDIAWNTNLAYLQADELSGHACRAIAMRDTDLGWMTKIVAARGSAICSLG